MCKFGMLSSKRRAIALIDYQQVRYPEVQSHDWPAVLTTSRS